jgi:hypothetical protein
MKNINLLKILLTIVTIATIIFFPIWIGPETMGGDKICLFCEWFLGVLRLIGIVLAGGIVCWVFSVVYDFWNQIIEK